MFMFSLFQISLKQKKAPRLGRALVTILKTKDIIYRNDPPDSAKNVTINIRYNN